MWVGKTGREQLMQKRKEKRGQRKDEPSRLTPKNTTSGSHCIQDQSGASVFLALESPEPLSISQLLGYKRSGSGEEVRLPKNSQRARDHRAQSSACCEQAPMSTHRKYPAVVHCVCVCVSKSVIVLHPNGAGWRKVPVLGASGCCSCLLVARLPGIDKAAPGPCQHTHFLTSMVSPVLKVFSRENKTARGAPVRSQTLANIDL